MDNLFINGGTSPRQHRPYGIGRFCLDVFMTLVTSGLWLIWILIREMRNS